MYDLINLLPLMSNNDFIKYLWVVSSPCNVSFCWQANAIFVWDLTHTQWHKIMIAVIHQYTMCNTINCGQIIGDRMRCEANHIQSQFCAVFCNKGYISFVIEVFDKLFPFISNDKPYVTSEVGTNINFHFYPRLNVQRENYANL